MNELERPDDDVEIRLGRLEAMVLDMQQAVTALTRACTHQLEQRALLDRVGVVTGVPVGVTSEHWHNPEVGGGWEGGGG